MAASELLVNDDNSGVTPEGATPLKLVSISVNDMHLSAGRTIEVRLRTSWRYKVKRAMSSLFRRPPPATTIEVPNPLEDFHHDADFFEFLRVAVAQYGHAELLDLKLQGDVLDPLAVTFEGRFGVPSTEGVSVYRLKRIKRGHPRFFRALAWFLIEHPNTTVTFFSGNHDSFIDFPAVQRRLRRWVTGGDAALANRVRFIDYQSEYHLVEDEVWYDHMMNAEPHTALDHKNPFVTERLGKKLRRPELNHPVGNLMVEQISNPAKLGNANVGRLADDMTWLEALLRGRFLWGLKMAFILALYILLSKHSLRSIMKTVLATAKKGDPVGAYAEKILRENEGVRAVIGAHSHRACRVTLADILKTYVNGGTWAEQFKLLWPKVEYKWKRLRWLEKGWRALRLYLYSAKTPFGRRATWLVLLTYVVSLIALTFFIQMSFVGVWAYTLQWLKVVGFVGLVFLLLKGFTHFFLVKPEVVPDPLLTCSLVRRASDGALLVDLMVYDPAEKTIRELV